MWGLTLDASSLHLHEEVSGRPEAGQLAAAVAKTALLPLDGELARVNHGIADGVSL